VYFKVKKSSEHRMWSGHTCVRMTYLTGW
jgi:hypothetical protein